MRRLLCRLFGCRSGSSRLVRSACGYHVTCDRCGRVGTILMGFD